MVWVGLLICCLGRGLVVECGVLGLADFEWFGFILFCLDCFG